MVSAVQPILLLLLACLLGVLLAYRLTVVGLALLSPVIAGPLWLVTGSLWLAILGFIIVQVGFFLPPFLSGDYPIFFSVPSAEDQMV